MASYRPLLHEPDRQDQLEQELSILRQAIMRAEPSVMVDGRFEQMITSPVTVIHIARQLIERLPTHTIQ